MADKKKQLGQLVLDTQDVEKKIQKINTMLGSIGKGANLDLTKLVNDQLSKKLNKLTEDVEKAVGGTKKKVGELQSVIVDIEKVTQTQGKATGTVTKGWTEAGKAATEYRNALGQLVKVVESESHVSDHKKRIEEEKQLQQAQEQRLKVIAQHDAEWRKQVQETNKQISADEERTRRQREKDEATLQSKLLQMERQKASEVKTSVEEQKRYWRDWAKTREQISKEAEASQRASQREELRAATENLKQQLELQRQIWGAKGDNERDTLLSQLDEKKRAFHEYSESVQQQAAADSSVIAMQQKLAVEAGKIADTVAANANKVKEQNDQSVLAGAVDEYKRILDLMQKAEQAPKGSNVKAVLETQLQEAKDAYNKYSKEIRDAVAADESVVELQRQQAIEEAKYKDALNAAATKKAEDYANKIGERVVTRIGRMELSQLKKQWNAAVDYASAYYDKLNEIRVVTGKTEAEAEKIGASYRKLAKEMKVTSTELSQAAVTFYRQGLSDAEVNNRLEAVTKYAKVANIEFTSAAEIVTAATNSMDIDVERVIDVFLRLGDSAATSGEEIGKGMQKAAASAATFGMDFEWLATYIATVSEKLRTAPETIGNAFNTMMARMHSIKEKGFNSEDATKINDVAKALKMVGSELMDQNGQWKEMDDLYIEIANKWDTLNDKEKAYIATTMAGTRQQNVFYALMNDLSKGIEGGSRAWTLYEKAVDAAGAANEKYAVWQESVAASQENMNRALEDLYANLQPSLIKGWYDGVAGLVDVMARGTEVLGGWNILLPALVVGFVAFRAILIKTTGAATLLSGAMTALEAHPMIAAVTAFVVVAGLAAVAIGSIASEIKSSKEKYEDAIDAIDQSQEKINDYKALKLEMESTFESVSGKTKLSASETEKYNSTLEKLSELSGTAKKAVRDLKDGMIDQAEAAGILSAEIDKLIENEKNLSRYQAVFAQDNLEKPSFLKKEQYDYSFDEYEEEAKKWGNGQGLSSAAGLQSFYIATKGVEEGVAGRIHDTIAYIRAQLSAYGKDKEDWGLVLSGVMDLLFASDKDFSQMKKEAEDYVNELIDLSITAAYGAMDKVDKEALRESLWKQIVGEDGILSFGEANSAGDILDKADFNILWGPRMITLLKDILGDVFYNVEDSIQEYAQYQGFSEHVTRLIEEALEAGLSKVDIKNVLSSLSTFDWKELDLETILTNIVSQKTDGIFSSDDFESFDEEAFKLMNIYLDQGHSAESLYEIWENSKSLDSFKESLKNFKQTADDAAGSEETLTKTTKAYVSEIEKAQKIIDAINKGKPIDLSTLRELAEEHPALMLANDTKELKAALESLIQEDEKGLISEWADKLLGDKDSVQAFLNSLDGETRSAFEAIIGEAETLKEALELTDDKTFIEKATEWAEQAATAFYNAKQEAEELKETTDALSELNGFNSEIDKLDSMIKTLKDGKNLSNGDLLGLLESHPEVLQYTDDTKTLIKVLEQLKKTAENKLEQGIKKYYSDTRQGLYGFRDYLKNANSDRLDYVNEFIGQNQEATLKDLIADAQRQIAEFGDYTLRDLIINYLNEVSENAKEATEEVKALVDASEKVNKYNSEISKLDSAIKTLEGGENLTMDDLLGLTESHPELLAYMGDVKQLTQVLKTLKDTTENKLKYSLMDYYASTREGLTGFRNHLRDNGGKEDTLAYVHQYIGQNQEATLNDLISEANKRVAEEGDFTLLRAINDYLLDIANGAVEATKQVDTLVKTVSNEELAADTERIINRAKSGLIGKDALGSYMQKQFGVGNVDLTNRPKHYDEGGYIETVDSILFGAGKGEGWDFENEKQIMFHITPILPDGTKLDEDSLREYVKEILDKYDSTDEMLEADKTENGGAGIFLKVEDVGDVGFEEAKESAVEWDEMLHDIQEAYYLGIVGLEEYTQAINEAFEVGKAEANGYLDQINALTEAAKNENLEDLSWVWGDMPKEMQDAFANKYPRVVAALKQLRDEGGKSEKTFKELGKALDSAKFTASARTFQGTAKAVDGLKNYTMSAADAMAAFDKEAEAAAKAQYEFQTANANMANGIEVTSDDVKSLADFLGWINPDVMLDNWDQVGPMISNALLEGRDAAKELQDALWFNITGTSTADFSDIENGIAIVGEDAERLIELLQATGMWELEEREVNGFQDVLRDGKIVREPLKGLYRILKPSGNNPFARNHTNFGSKSSGKKSGGGGGSRKKNGDDTSNNSSSSSGKQMTEVERMLDVMEQIQKFQSHTKDMYSAMAKYYEGTGELQGVIAYLELEKKSLADINATLEANVKDIEAQMKAKQAEIATMTNSGEAYEEVADDLNKLQSKHQEYTKQLIANKTEMDSLTKAIKKQQDAIRDMEIDLRQTIYKAIEDREALIERKLQGRITLENEIIELIKLRYEKERDMILENSQAQIDALQKERDLLSEQLELRKQQDEEEDKRKKLNDLEEKYQRIVADPTRRKEALSIQKQITELREEMAWDLAEKEVKAQQDAIDEQITSIEDYMEYVRNYYDDLFEHPKKLIEEMESIITQTDEYIMNWLKENSEAYAEATAATQQSMLNNWEKMLLDMHGALKLYWDEVEDIISQGNEAIIKFLMENSADYKKAGKLQAEAYVSEWIEKLNNLALAHRQIAAQMIQTNYAIIASAQGGSSSSGSSDKSSSSSEKSSSKKSGKSGSTTIDSEIPAPSDTPLKDHYYDFTYHGQHYSQHGFSSMAEAGNAGRAKLASLGGNQHDTSSFYYYKQGGMADFTGPAWLDGTKTKPERILSPLQTELFESLVRSLETMSKVRVPGMPAFGETGGGANPVNVGDIIVNVDKMETDADYEAMAERVFEEIMNRLNRGAPVGGIRF